MLETVVPDITFILRCPLEALSESFFAKMTVRQHTNKSVSIHVKFQFTAVPCKQKFCNVRKCLKLMLTCPVPNFVKILLVALDLFHADGQTGGRRDIKRFSTGIGMRSKLVAL
jgi:hypothetical protein